MTDQKSIAQELDRAASRSDFGASGKQCWFLASLMIKAGDTPADWDIGYTHTNAVLTKKKASFIIDQYLNGPRLN
jgi:hypothetical protein